MSIDDKFGIGAGLLALGLAAGVILLGQLTYNKDFQAELDKIPAPAADSGKVPAAADSGKAPTAVDSGKAPQSDSAADVHPSLLYRLIPHRELVVPEAIFDGILCALALPAGIYFFVLGALSESKEKEPDKT